MRYEPLGSLSVKGREEAVDALVAAGISTVVYAVSDPNSVAAGGAARLAESAPGTMNCASRDEDEGARDDQLAGTRAR